MAERTELKKLLVLGGPTLGAEGILAFLREHFDVRMAEDLDDALGEMRNARYDAVLAETADFLPLERGVVTQQASVVLDRIGDGVCIVGESGELVWTNSRLRAMPKSVLDSLRKLCLTAYEQFAAGRKAGDLGKKFSLMPEDGKYFEVICSPVRDHKGLLRQVAAVVIDATSQRRQQMKLNAIERAGRELVRLEHETLKDRDAIERLQFLEERIISCSQEVLDYQHFALLLLDERSNRLETLISVGLTDAAEKYEFFASTEGNGICGYVAATGRSYICGDVRKDPRYVEGLEDSRSSLTVPLRLRDKVVGVLNAEATSLNAFTEEDRQFSEIFANYIALAMHILNLLVFERHSIHNQITGSICAELSGPLSDMVTDLNEVLEDYIGHDDLRNRLNKVIDRAMQARQTVQRFIASPATGVMNAPCEPVQKDPTLNGKHILVADDEELIRTTIRDVLNPYGCTVDTAGDGGEAIEMIDKNEYDLVISDIKMPNATGYEVFSAAKKRDVGCEVILITGFGYDPRHSIVKANKEGLHAVIMKPFKVKQLLDTCREALQKQNK
ncbi:MAG: response regulator [Phycisphaerae bacterium]